MKKEIGHILLIALGVTLFCFAFPAVIVLLFTWIDYLEKVFR
jgi:hypothetical protein